MVNDVLLASDTGSPSVLVLLDLTTAFDTIDHPILIARLEKLVGLSGNVLSWFKSYLSNRLQYEDDSSALSEVTCGVPQGSVIGPILFALYMLPLGAVVHRHEVNFHCYADDTQLYLSLKPGDTSTVNVLTACLADIQQWM